MVLFFVTLTLRVWADAPVPPYLVVYEKFQKALHEGKTEEINQWKNEYTVINERLVEQGDAEAAVRLGVLYGKDHLSVAAEPEKALRWFTKAAELGDSSSQIHVGYLYEQGIGTQKDAAEATHWYSLGIQSLEKKAEQGDADALFWLGILYDRGQGVEQNLPRAYSYYLRAAEKAHVEAQRIIAYGYKQGRGVEKSDEKALHWFTLAADSGAVDAMMELGLSYRDGIFTPVDDVQAVAWFTKAVQTNNNPYGLRYLADMLVQGKGCAKDEEKALGYYRQAASYGDVLSALAGAKLAAKSHPDIAYDLARHAAEQSTAPEASYIFAMMEKQRGHKDSYISWMTNAAEQAYVPAMEELGISYITPFSGVSWNPMIARYWWQEAVSRGSERAGHYLSLLYWVAPFIIIFVVTVFLLWVHRKIKQKIQREEVSDLNAKGIK